MTVAVDALRESVARLRGLVAGLSDDRLQTPAYPTEWTIADVLSHIGSAAVIQQQRLEDALAGRSTADDFAPGIWDKWNAKSPTSKAADGLAADATFAGRLQQLTDQGADVSIAMGPLTLDLAALTGLRLNEHALHTWDIEVVLDPTATLPAQATAVVVDNLELIGRFTAKPTGATRSVAVHVTEPERDFAIQLTPEKVTFEAGANATSQPDLTMPAEAFVRLIYGRLDPDHTPAVSGDEARLDELRIIYPGP